uniref:Uncharacterized protein n=2 Tax=unclassified Caudoviricetes TaxID=2788787 RepID=A0AB39ABU6_9CAUD
MSKHTPGPWFQHRNGSSTVYIEARIGGGLIQEVAACGPTEEGTIQQSANAKLIASAPDLLESLSRLINWHDAIYGDDCDYSGDHPVAKAKALIARFSDNV